MKIVQRYLMALFDNKDVYKRGDLEPHQERTAKWANSNFKYPSEILDIMYNPKPPPSHPGLAPDAGSFRDHRFDDYILRQLQKGRR
jgi:hypothetical protein